MTAAMSASGRESVSSTTRKSAGMTAIASSAACGMPSDTDVSNGGDVPRPTASCQPLKWPSNRSTRVPPGERAREPQGEHRAFRPGVGEADSLGGRNQTADELRPLDHGGMVVAEVPARSTTSAIAAATAGWAWPSSSAALPIP